MKLLSVHTMETKKSFLKKIYRCFKTIQILILLSGMLLVSEKKTAAQFEQPQADPTGDESRFEFPNFPTTIVSSQFNNLGISFNSCGITPFRNEKSPIQKVTRNLKTVNFRSQTNSFISHIVRKQQDSTKVVYGIEFDNGSWVTYTLRVVNDTIKDSLGTFYTALSALFNYAEYCKTFCGDQLYTITNYNVYTSSDAGVTWQLDTAGISGLGYYDVSIDTSQNVYLGIQYTALGQPGLYKQAPGSSIWSSVPFFLSKQVNKIVTDRRDRLFVSDYSSLYVSPNEGVTFSVDTAGLQLGPLSNPIGFFYTNEISDDVYGNIYVITRDQWNGRPDRIYRSDGGTAPFVRIDGPVTAQYNDPMNLQHFNNMIGDSALLLATKFGDFASVDSGRTWVKADSGASASNVYGLVWNSNGDAFGTSTLGLFKQNANESSWTQKFPVNSYLSGRPVFIDNSNTVYTLGNFADSSQWFDHSAFTWKSSDNGNTWQLDTAGFSIVQVSNINYYGHTYLPGDQYYRFYANPYYVDETGTQHIINTTSGNVLAVYAKPSGQPWSLDTSGLSTAPASFSDYVWGSDGSGNIYLALSFGPFGPSKLGIWKRPVSGGPWVPDSNGIQSAVSAYQFAVSASGQMLVSTKKGIFINTGTSWSALPYPSSVPTTDYTYALAVDDSGGIYCQFIHYIFTVGDSSDGVYYTHDNGASWTFFGGLRIIYRNFVAHNDTCYGLSYDDGVVKYSPAGFPNGGINLVHSPSLALEIYPNPLEGNLLFIKTEATNQNFNYQVYDVLGNQLLSGVSKQEQPIDVSTLHSGLYVLELTSPGFTGVKKFIVL